jgi:GNAT superfamily N-acetyltransferase
MDGKHSSLCRKRNHKITIYSPQEDDDNMMTTTFQHITTRDKEAYLFARNLLVDSFPPEEYRDLSQWEAYIDTQEEFKLCVLRVDNTPVGIAAYWLFDTFCYGEHLATIPEVRGKGYGKLLVEWLCEQAPGKPVVLEVELPETEIAARRIRFYERNGFVLCTEPYLQPPYRKGDKAIPMHLMIHGDLSSTFYYNQAKTEIYTKVYGVRSI